MAVGVAAYPWSLTQIATLLESEVDVVLALYRWTARGGKSTVSALVSARLSPSVLIRGDAFYRFLDQGAVAPWLPEATDQNRVVIRASGAAAGRFVRGGYEAVYDGVLGPWWLPTFFEATELDDLHYAILLASAERCGTTSPPARDTLMNRQLDTCTMSSSALSLILIPGTC
ncbi:MAG: hypothetical protein ABIP53_05305 [Candidatus Limnocylindrales bacterium]